MNQSFTFHRVCSLPLHLIQKAGKPVLIFSLILFASGRMSMIQAQKSTSESSLKAREMTFEKAAIERLFGLKSGEKSKLSLSADKASKADFDIRILNNMHPGEKSGAVAIIISFGKEEARLLMNRKDRNGKLEYWIAILPNQGTEGYTLSQETKSEFVLTRTPKDQIVTE